MGNGLLFDGDDDSVEVQAAFIGTLDSYTVSWWARYDGNGEDTPRSYFARLNGDVFWPRCWRLDEIDYSGAAICQYQIDGMTNSINSPTHTLGETIHMALVRTPTPRSPTCTGTASWPTRSAILPAPCPPTIFRFRSAAVSGGPISA